MFFKLKCGRSVVVRYCACVHVVVGDGDVESVITDSVPLPYVRSLLKQFLHDVQVAVLTGQVKWSQL